ncbi:DUF6844 domain-containing protein [Sutterella megalosphaeroides]|uniref:DUF6844 domain-containing protein n=1 Tax=Sutterella megalosphaeroides TaxID=2494234 RepID=A0A2Z6I8W4_9BURK|nr:hypothetical protein [Sutterella megalosphaeroides]BBF22849.1 hypothetical protein SUTMEG_07400 [Sutterella megalosphaeroides]
MLKTQVFAALAALFVMGGAPVRAAEAPVAPAADATNAGEPAPVETAVNETDAFFGAGSEIDKVYQEWLDSASAKTLEGCKKKGRDLSQPECRLEQIIYTGDATVTAEKTDPKWIERRQLAFMEASLNALAQFAEGQSLTNSVESLREYVQDDRPIPEDPFRAKGRISEMLDKVMALGDAMLNKYLNDYGVDPAAYAALPQEERKKMLELKLTSRSTMRAAAEMTGLVPLMTFEGSDGRGGHVVRVVYVASPERVSTAKSILRNQAKIGPNDAKKNPRGVARFYELPPEKLFTAYGVRMVYDEEGYPVLLAYGQSGVEKTPDKNLQGMLITQARNDARSAAINQLTLLLQSSVAKKAARSSVSTLASEAVKVRNADGSVASKQETENTLYKQVEEATSVTGRISNFAGVRVVKTWQWVEPQSHLPVVGAVVMWSPKTASVSEAIATARPTSPSAPAPAAAAKPAVKEKSGVSSGLEADDYEF